MYTHMTDTQEREKDEAMHLFKRSNISLSVPFIHKSITPRQVYVTEQQCHITSLLSIQPICHTFMYVFVCFSDCGSFFFFGGD